MDNTRNPAASTRRRFLQIAPGVAVASIMPVADAMSKLSTADRARHHFDEMCKALSELAGDGWTLYASEKKPFATLSGGRYTGLGRIEYEMNAELGLPGERHIPMMGVL